MPHAEEHSGMPLVNGDKNSSQFISHLKSYPIVSDSITSFKQNPYGAKSVAIVAATHNSIVKPVLPYASKPYGYVQPYVHRADELASSGLDNIDARFPIVKSDTETIKGTVLDYAFLPLALAVRGRQYLLSTYSSEYKKCGGDGYVAGGKAVITTSLVLTSDVLGKVGEFLGKSKANTEETIKEKTSQ